MRSGNAVPVQVERFAVPRGSDMGIFLDDQGMLADLGGTAETLQIPDADKSASLR